MRKILIPLCTFALLGVSALPAAAQGGPNAAGGASGPVANVPQVAGVWHGQAHDDPSLSALVPTQSMNPSLQMNITEDSAGTLGGSGTLSVPQAIVPLRITGKASSNGTINIQMGMQMTGSISGRITCSNGSTGQVMSGKFTSKEAFGTFSIDTCPVL